ncbi:PREDICTED: coiled-coil domain-containing protein 157-like [Papilio xuthus]|uniref:Coiled-coil domain-containing protein 157-like n=1 Tax=Papilio xuthus TaxID=66420 RepID=A0AAJ6ZKK4_PAPXU|nr:PREDICTED: coiled-coil domain-containing protein 157-like [Papilio xuthus]
MRPDRQRIAKLKLQFDDSLTRTFEYPSETSLCEDSPQDAPCPAPSPAPSPAPTPASCAAPSPASCAAPAASTLAANTHLGKGTCSRNDLKVQDYPAGVSMITLIINIKQ